MSRVVFEYLAAGRPLIAARVGVVPEVLADREHALLVPGGDAEALSAALAEMLGDDALRRRLGVAGRALIEERYSGSRAGRGARTTLRSPGRRVKVSIVAFDLSDNATGRADLLARLLAPRYQTHVVGPRFGAGDLAPGERRGAWPTALVARLALSGLRSTRAAPARADRRRRASTPRSCGRPATAWPSWRARAGGDRSSLDIDDWELGFFYRSGPWRRIGRALNLANPNGLPWTWLMERWCGGADALTVASRFPAAALRRHADSPRARHRGLGSRALRSAGRPRQARRSAGATGGHVPRYAPRPTRASTISWRRWRALRGDVRAGRSSASSPASAEAARWAARPFVRLVARFPSTRCRATCVAADVVAVPQRATTRHRRAGAGQALRRHGPRATDRLDRRCR